MIEGTTAMPGYVEILPAPPLRGVVERYWFLEGAAGDAGSAAPIVPDGRPEIVVHLADPFRRLEGERELRQPRTLFAAQIDRPLRVEPCGAVDLAGIRFRPSGARALVGAPMGELLNATPALSDLALRLARRIEAALLAAGHDPAARAHALDATLVAALGERRSARRADARVALAVREIERASGAVSVDALARAASLSARQLERAFLRDVGLAPKRFARITRFRAVIGRRTADPAAPWAAVAHDLGYTDQAHLVREFREFAGVSPAAWFSRGGEGLSDGINGVSDFDKTTGSGAS
jgi:AraC-like DNA-binding protein